MTRLTASCAHTAGRKINLLVQNYGWFPELILPGGCCFPYKSFSKQQAAATLPIPGQIGNLCRLRLNLICDFYNYYFNDQADFKMFDSFHPPL